MNSYEQRYSEPEQKRSRRVAPRRDRADAHSRADRPVASAARLVAHLQRRLGNAATTALLHRTPDDTRQDLAAAIEARRSSSTPLSDRTRADFEDDLGVDLSAVRVHTGPDIDALAGALHAEAFTTGTDIFVRSEGSDPGSEHGQRLMAHELAHVVQQATGEVETAQVESGVRVSDPTGRFEREAEQYARERTRQGSREPRNSNSADRLANEGPMEGVAGMRWRPVTSPSRAAVVLRQAAPGADGGTSAATAGGTEATAAWWLNDKEENRCKPYATRAQAREVRDQLRQGALFELLLSNSEVAEIYSAYLHRKHGDSLARRVYAGSSSPIATAFAESAITAIHQRTLLEHVAAALGAGKLPGDLAPGVPTAVPVATLLSRADINYPINWSRADEVPGHIAGGISGSDVGPDQRKLSGSVILTRQVDTQGRTVGVHVRTAFHFLVLDAFDFCPGGTGTPEEAKITLPLSRLEKSGEVWPDEAFAYDVPFEVRFDGPPLEMDLPLATVRTVYRDAVAGEPGLQPTPAPVPAPTTVPPAPPSEDVRSRD